MRLSWYIRLIRQAPTFLTSQSVSFIKINISEFKPHARKTLLRQWKSTEVLTVAAATTLSNRNSTFEMSFLSSKENPIDDLWRLFVGTQTPPRFSRCFIWDFFTTRLCRFIALVHPKYVCTYIYIYIHQDLWENLCNSNALWPSND